MMAATTSYQRVTSADPCPFCELLASRVDLAATAAADFPAHDHCSCTAEPIFDVEGRQLTPQQAQMQRLWDEVAGSAGTEREALNAWSTFWRDHPVVTSPAFARRVLAAARGNRARAAARTSIVRRRRVGTRSVATDRPADDQWLALRQYKRGQDRNINNALRAGATPPPQVRLIDDAMAASPLRAPTVTYRGALNGDAVFGQATGRNMTGMVWTERGYVSTTSQRHVARGYARAQPTSVVMRLHTPRGVGAVDMSGNRHEAELLLQRDLRMRVVADSGPGSGPPRLLDVEVIP